MPGAGSSALPMRYYDGLSSKAQNVVLSIAQQTALIHSSENGALIQNLATQKIGWPERTRHGARMVNLPGGAQLHADNAAAYDAWAAAHLPGAESLVVRAQQSWRGVVLALVLLSAVLGAFYQWGLPVAARGIASLVPQAVDETLGSNALAQIDGQWMLPSKLPLDTQIRLRERFAQTMKTAYPGAVPKYQLEFRQSKIGPNAFALPGGTMVMTDELVKLVNDDEVVMGVMGHEVGHVMLRHGLRQLVHLAVIQGVLSVAFGDYGSLITTAPLILGSMGYSRDAEREADAHSIEFMHANRISPLVMVKFFEAMRAEQKTKTQKTPLGISIISSHPADQERMDAFRAAAGQPKQ